MSNDLLKVKILEHILDILNNISGYYVYQLIGNLNIYLLNKNFLNKWWLGRFIEKYIVGDILKDYKYDIFYLNWELKTIFFDFNRVPNYDVLLISVSLFNFFNKKFKNLFVRKIKKILWVSILGKKRTFVLYKIIGKYFITFLDENSIYFFFNEIKLALNCILNNNLLMCKYFYTKNFKLEFLINNRYKKFKNLYFRIYLRKKILLNFFKKYKIIN